MNLRTRLLLWRYRANVADLEALQRIALPTLAERQKHINTLAERLSHAGITVPRINAQDIRRDIERQLKLGALL